MSKYTFIAPCHFGLESVLKKEITDLGYEIKEVSDGRVTFAGDEAAIARCNVFLRTTERVLLLAGSFKALTFDELFEKTKSIAWEDFLPIDAKFWVKKASSVRSALFSPKDIQSIVKKAVVERMKEHYKLGWCNEDGYEYPLRVFINKDIVTIALDTTGESLHKRGYRTNTTQAPLSETLAAALLKLTPWRGGRTLVDPFCGSGTFPIEAALIAADIAPGMGREFTAEKWTNIIKKKLWYEAVTEANDRIDLSKCGDIQGYDIDEASIRMAVANARNAGVEKQIHFQKRDVKDLSHAGKYGFIITNPPYGERLSEKAALPELYRTMAESFKKLDTWSYYILTAYDKVEDHFGRKADKNRKIYNGMIKTYFYSFIGPRPPKKGGDSFGSAPDKARGR
ncbi:MAG: class I SAM-dependent RNA methyltransferase [Lachnospiraceae bacterium]|nr:class I SAM-dependent RNA methyltransferase [Lachnospiraceae bacterium]